MKNRIKKMITYLLVISCVITSVNILPLKVEAEEKDETKATITKSENDYYKYKQSIENISLATESIELSARSVKVADGAQAEIKEEYLGKPDVLVWQKAGTVTWEVSVPKDARYNVRISYSSLEETSLDFCFGIKIDGEYPFQSAANMKMPRMWEDASDIRKDDLGNEFTPEQKLYDGFVEKAIYDHKGLEVHPYQFVLTAGNHSISLEHVEGSIAIDKIILAKPDNAEQSYEEVLSHYIDEGYEKYDGVPVITEGEDAVIKSDNSIIVKSDNSSLQLTPASAKKSLINYIGGTSWQNSNDEIIWSVNVPQDGLYKLGIMYKQDQIVDGLAYRHLRVDGFTPFEEAANIAFPYSTGWEFLEFGNNQGEAYYFYLAQGEHELSLSVTLGPTAEFYNRMKAVVEQLGDLYIDIVMITGETPDPNRDYELFKQIPGFTDTLSKCHDELTDLVVDVQKLTGERGSNYIAAIQNMARVLKNMIENQYLAHQYVSTYYSNYVTLSSWLYEMTVMPLSIDQIRLAAPNGEFGQKKVGFFEKLWFSIQRFFASFSEEYDNVSKESDKDEDLTIWVNWGRDQAQVLNSLIEETFTAETGINVNLEVVNADLVKGLLADNYPDLSLQMARSTPVNLAMRGALYDLTNFEDYDSIVKRFGESASVPYEYNEGVFALPDQQSFYIMFYRTDIFERLNLEVPETWVDFMATSAVLQRNNMTSYLPYTQITAATTTDQGVGGLNLYATILMQNGGEFYNVERNKSELDSVVALQSFKTWTDMYTQYKLPTTIDFYNRFRVGTCPLGIATYTEYMKFQQAAPEIQGRWAIALVPGTKQDDGTINRTVSGAGTACSILEKSKHKEEAWEFLKWWTSAETQTRYNANVESILGPISRITTANVEAFSDMGWEEKDLNILLQQREQIQEIPEIPGSYYLTRAVDQVFWSVVNGESSVKDALDKWSLEVNREIERKISEYSEGEE